MQSSRVISTPQRAQRPWPQRLVFTLLACKNERMSIVYILINESMPGLIKIGRTSTSVLQRMSELNRHAGIPLPFECFYAARVNDSDFVEKRLHEAFADHRVRQQREFFRLSPSRAQSALQLAALEDVTPRDEIVDDFPEDAAQALAKESRRRSIPSFEEYGIPLGGILTFVKNREVTSQVDGDKTVLFKGKSQSLSAAALSALRDEGFNWTSARGIQFWEYDGELILDKWERLQEPSEF
jgi:hypothetical protein